MILDKILEFVFGIFSGLLGLLPKFEFQINFGGAVGDSLGMVNEFVDVRTVLVAIGTLLAIFVAVELFQLVVWILKKLHILG